MNEESMDFVQGGDEGELGPRRESAQARRGLGINATINDSLYESMLESDDVIE